MAAAVIEETGFDLRTIKRVAPPWTMLESATQITESLTTSKMLRESGLANWNISLIPLAEMLTDYRFTDEAFGVVRKGRGRAKDTIMGIVGGRYQPVQNEQIFAFGDALLKVVSGKWEAAGTIKDGKVVFGAIDAGRSIKIGKDIVDFYLMVQSSHDGSVALSVTTTAVRRASQSVLNLNLTGAEQAFRLRHTPSVSEAVAAAQEAIVASDEYISRFEEVANALYGKPVSERQFENLVSIVYPKPSRDTRGALSRWNTKRKVLQEIYDGEGVVDTMKDIRGTAWGALCTFIERIDYHRSPRLDNVENLLVASSGFDAMTNMEKNKIATAVMNWAKVK